MSLELVCSWCEEARGFRQPQDAADAGWFLFLPDGDDPEDPDAWRSFCSIDCWVSAQ